MSVSIGCKVSYADGGDVPISGDDLAEVTLPNEIVEALDRLTHGTDDYRKRKAPGLIDPGMASFTMFYDGSVYATLNEMKLSREKKVWKFETPQNDTYAIVVEFEAFITSCNANFTDIAALSKIEVELCLTGKEISWTGDTDTDE